MKITLINHHHRLVATLATIAFIALAFVPSPPVVAGDNAQEHTDLLATERWREHSYGISLRPPLGSRLMSQTADDAILRIYGQGGYTIRLYIKKAPAQLTVQRLITQAIHQLGGAYPSATILDQQWPQLADRPAAAIYFRIPDRKQGPWVMAQTFLRLDSTALLMAQLEADEAQYPQARPAFEAMLASLEIQDPKEINQARTEQINRGESWRQKLTTQQLHDAIEPNQWLRIIENGEDIGYMRIKEHAVNQMGHSGIRIDVQTRINVNNRAVDSIANFFASDNGEHEVWSVRTTLRPLHAANKKTSGPQKNTTSWAETGVRSKDRITVNQETPTGIKDHHWERPSQGYLTQVELMMIERVLGDNTPDGEMGFYAYSPSTQQIVYRTVGIQINPDGTRVVRSRPSPEQNKQISHYSSDGKLTKRQLPDGHLVVPTTTRELSAKWTLR